MITVFITVSCVRENTKVKTIADSVSKEHESIKVQEPQGKVNNPQRKVESKDTVNLKSLSPEQTMAKFGKPVSRDEFDLSQPLSEFRIEILNYIPEKDRYSSSIKFRELTWNYVETDNMITLWYQNKGDKWVCIDYAVWNKNAAF